VDMSDWVLSSTSDGRRVAAYENDVQIDCQVAFHHSQHDLDAVWVANECLQGVKKCPRLLT